MTVRVLKGSKQEIAQQVANLEGDVREAIVFFEESVSSPTEPVPPTAEELFREMEPHMVNVGEIDDSREAIYQRMEGE